MAAVIALIVCTVLAMMFSSTRGIGILGTGILILLFPVITTAIVLMGGVAFFVYRYILKGN
jgi:hypothetical protein